ncbi:MAG: hypothetical protein OXE97_12485, partial [Gammaproteobacteria bacterium]|nr:hypothetical protein [Gammaproteobacteria bacterium]
TADRRPQTADRIARNPRAPHHLKPGISRHLKPAHSLLRAAFARLVVFVVPPYAEKPPALRNIVVFVP